MAFHRLAPAKINLFLHVGPRQDDGYHPVASLMVFAGVGDRLSLAVGEAGDLATEGPFAAGLADAADNLVARARDRVLARMMGTPAPFAMTLEKRLPVAAGLGGGSSDAAAALALIADAAPALGLARPAKATLVTLARGLGADVAACLEAAPVLAEGRGDVLRPSPHLPTLNVVLANPLRPVSTAAVYRAFDEGERIRAADLPDPPAAFGSAAAVADWLATTRNDLERPALGLEPAIGETLAALSAAPETLMARISGSGATCFALAAGRREAEALARRIATDHPGWWVRPCRIGDATA